MNFQIELQALDRQYHRLIGERDLLTNQLQQAQTQLVEDQALLQRVNGAQVVARLVAQAVQKQIAWHLGNITTRCLQVVFGNNYSVKAEFNERRGKLECDVVLVKDQLETDPLDSNGGGVVDVLSFAFKVAVWAITAGQRHPTIVLDEPFKHLSLELHGRAMEMVRQLADQMGMQILMVTHSPELAEGADKVYRVSLRARQSIVQEVIK